MDQDCGWHREREKNSILFHGIYRINIRPYYKDDLLWLPTPQERASGAQLGIRNIIRDHKEHEIWNKLGDQENQEIRNRIKDQEEQEIRNRIENQEDQEIRNRIGIHEEQEIWNGTE